MLEVEACFVQNVESLMDMCEETIAGFLQPILSIFNDEEKSRVQSFITGTCRRISYDDARQICGLEWGSDLKSCHERLITDRFGPTFVHSYPAHIKPFYMKAKTINGDFETDGAFQAFKSERCTAQCFDLLLPGSMGEGAGGSIREEAIDQLEANMLKRQIDADLYRWYLDINRWGAVPHGGFGIGFDRLIAFIMGQDNVRDVVLFPRDLSTITIA
jgi:asparaginyl-tRNA synthetase